MISMISTNNLLFLGGSLNGIYRRVPYDMKSIKIPKPAEIKFFEESTVSEIPDLSYETYNRSTLFSRKTLMVREVFTLDGLHAEEKDHLLHLYLMESFINGQLA